MQKLPSLELLVSHFVGVTSKRTLRTLKISLLLAMLMFGYVLGCSNGSDHEGPEWAPPPGHGRPG